jgi:hypothetical protein
MAKDYMQLAELEAQIACLHELPKIGNSDKKQ